MFIVDDKNLFPKNFAVYSIVEIIGKIVGKSHIDIRMMEHKMQYNLSIRFFINVVLSPCLVCERRKKENLISPRLQHKKKK